MNLHRYLNSNLTFVRHEVSKIKGTDYRLKCKASTESQSAHSHTNMPGFQKINKKSFLSLKFLKTGTE